MARFSRSFLNRRNRMVFSLRKKLLRNYYIGGSNIDVWTVDELTELLKEFKKNSSGENLDSVLKEEDRNSNSAIEENKVFFIFLLNLNENQSENKLESKEKDLFDDENYQKIVTCKEVNKPSTDLNIPELLIEIPKFFFDFFIIKNLLCKKFPNCSRRNIFIFICKFQNRNKTFKLGSPKKIF